MGMRWMEKRAGFLFRWIELEMKGKGARYLFQ
jgi:hypothetical protein